MKKRVILFLLVFCLAASQTHANNLLANGDFESGRLKGAFSNGYPEGWEWGWGSNGQHHNNTGYKYDNWGVAIWGDDTGLVQDIPAREGDTFTLSGYMIHPDGEPLTNRKGLFRIEFWDGPLQGDTKLAETQIGVLTDSNSTDTWFHNSGSATAPAGTTEARIVLMLLDTGGSPSGKAYFDNMSLTIDNLPAFNPNFNGDLFVDFSDLKELLNDWLETPSDYDMDGDSDVDMNDFSIFASDWGVTIPNHPGYELEWSDEFYGSRINYENWAHQIGDGTEYGIPMWGNGELQYYTARPENSYVRNGNLVIIARDESYQGRNYTSARLHTFAKQDFLYGKMEARIKLPTTKGMWPAFWMLPTDWVYGGWAASGEIDIMESINIATTIYGTIAYGGEWPNYDRSGGSYSDGNDFSEGFHVYTLEWEPFVMRWYVDGILYSTKTSWWCESGTYPAPFDKHFHFLLNIAVGGGWPGPPDGSTVFPQQMVIDWIRVYRKLP